MDSHKQILVEEGKDYVIAFEGLAEIEEWKGDLERALAVKADELARAKRVLDEKERLLEVFHRIGQVTLSSLDLDEVLDNLTEQVIEAGLFRSFMVALVDEDTQQARVVRTFTRAGQQSGSHARRVGRRVEDDDTVAEVARLGQLRIVQGRGGSDADLPEGMAERRQERIFYYIPVRNEDRVLAVLGTDSVIEERADLERRIEAMQPLIDQVAIAIEHALTSRKLAETQLHLIQADKMASLGQLAAGVAHEINNPVGFVASNLETLREYVETFKTLLGAYERLAASQGGDQAAATEVRDLREGDEVSYMLEDIDGLLAESREGMFRVTEIVQGLKSFARLDASELESADLNAALEDTLKIVWNELKYRCEVVKVFGELPRVRCYPGQLKQVFMNLLTNAAQSIEEQGEIRIETRQVEDLVEIAITDTGRGIPEEILGRIFEPFFTTKPVGQGTGLGLAISYGIIQAHKGSIEVQSDEGRGTCFIVRLPLGEA